MKRRKGAALPVAIMLVSLLLIITMGVAFLVVNNVTVQRLEAIAFAKRVECAQAYGYFIAHDGAVPSASENYTYSKLEQTINSHAIKGLIAKNKGGNMVFYGIYDFTADKTLAYQGENFYIVTIDETSYLGGILPMEAAS